MRYLGRGRIRRQGDHRFRGDQSNRSSRGEKRRKARGGDGNRKRKIGRKALASSNLIRPIAAVRNDGFELVQLPALRMTALN